MKVNMKQPCVYILTNRRNGTLYIGVSSNLSFRLATHQDAIVDGFTKRYQLKLLVWYELHDSMDSAIAREKALKKWSRRQKLILIENSNPNWRDLSSDL